MWRCKLPDAPKLSDVPKLPDVLRRFACCVQNFPPSAPTLLDLSGAPACRSRTYSNLYSHHLSPLHGDGSARRTLPNPETRNRSRTAPADAIATPITISAHSVGASGAGADQRSVSLRCAHPVPKLPCVVPTLPDVYVHRSGVQVSDRPGVLKSLLPPPLYTAMDLLGPAYTQTPKPETGIGPPRRRQSSRPSPSPHTPLAVVQSSVLSPWNAPILVAPVPSRSSRHAAPARLLHI